MYTSFTIKNFRGFADITVAPLARVNLIAGTNGIGKTSLLEALFLHLGPNSPRLSMVLNILRGIQQRKPDTEEVWGWLFRDRATEAEIQLIGTSEEGLRRTLTLRLVAAEEMTLTRPHNGDVSAPLEASATSTAGGPLDLLLEYQDSAGRTGTARASLGADSLRLRHFTLPDLPVGVFVGATSATGQDDIERLSELEAAGRHDDILSALRVLDARLRRLSVLVVAGIPAIYADIGLTRLIPFQILGRGVGRLLTIVLAIASTRDGVVLVDEIENGLHYSILPDVWTAVATLSQETRTQVFATTHSWECIQAAHQAFAAREAYDFHLHRLEAIQGHSLAVTLGQEMLAAALQADLEIR